jgi:hypothetical protein
MGECCGRDTRKGAGAGRTGRVAPDDGRGRNRPGDLPWRLNPRARPKALPRTLRRALPRSRRSPPLLEAHEHAGLAEAGRAVDEEGGGEQRLAAAGRAANQRGPPLRQLDGLVAQGKLAIDHVRVERSEIEETGEYDLEGLFIRLGFAVDSIGAKRIPPSPGG